jgi:hypothetical protein
MIAYFINPADQTVTQITLADWDAIRAKLGGYLEVACSWQNGDVLFVDEEGFLKPQELYFRLTERPDQPFAGVGVLVGREKANARSNHPPGMTLNELRSRVSFLSRAAVVELLRARPSVTVTSIDDGVLGETEIIATWDEMLDASKPPGTKA